MEASKMLNYINNGFENIPQTFLNLFEGKNKGK